MVMGFEDELDSLTRECQRFHEGAAGACDGQLE